LDVSAISAIVALGDPLLKGVSPHKSSYLKKSMKRERETKKENVEKIGQAGKRGGEQGHTRECQWTTSQRQHRGRFSG
jgi:hypothetical protein